MTRRGRILRELLNAVLVAAGILSAGFGLRGFLMSSNFIDGGVTGISMLASKVTRVPLWLLLPAINLPFVALAYRQLGRAFAVRSVLAIAGLSAALEVIPYPDVTPDLVLTAVFGGVFIGAGIGLAIRGGAVMDGMEVAAILISRRSDLLKLGDVVLGLNVVIFSAAILVLGTEAALYSILTYAAAARTLEFVVNGIEQYTSITIISDRGPAIRERITRLLGRGVTVFQGRGGVEGQPREILYCVATRLEIGAIKGLVRELDPSAFTVTQTLADVEGGRVKAVHH